MALGRKALEEIFDRKLQPLLSKIDQINIKVDKAISSISFLSMKFEELNTKVTTLERSNKELKAENTYLRNEVNKMADHYKYIRETQNELEQYGRRECLEVRGIPKLVNENTNQIVIDMASKIGVDVKEEDISVSHRLWRNQ